ncbi:hypothetical protein DWQ65_12010 [Treponema phagedenis]|uniref:S46 family peptidase n=1 Tax=Treponema phagedenis TaxID=162 RepID=A0A0B7GRI3_TREPH|nr:hypothetical protein [Treponema phagedenis]NVP23553.1 hypothetical protein [Treponema phagedenis]QEJ98686.1 S46 family peptidase [Treponema phagedenis]QEK04192.1 S46 family peptidase [Treponema phagedenis]QEK09808.1 S46 family peptidase [Treponema phagedenis]QLC58392.1 hypothetical protein HW453_05845 [Treponema phagedenis]
MIRRIAVSKKPFLFLCLFGIAFASAAEENLYDALLQYRLENGAVYKEIQMQSDIASNEYQKTKLNSLIVTEIGSGNTSINLGRKDGASYTTEPNARILLPSYNNTGVSVSVPLSKTEAASSVGANVKVSTDIYSKNRKAQQLKRTAAKQQADEALQKKLDGKRLAEQSFLKEIKDLYGSYLNYLSKKLAKVDADIKFEQIKVQKYGANSTIYRTAQLRQMDAQRDLQAAEFSFQTAFAYFAESCGRSNADVDKFLTELALTIPQEKIADVKNLSIENSRDFLRAQNEYRQKLLQREVEHSPFTLSAEAGYAWKKTEGSAGGSTISETTNAILGGLSMKFPGGSLYTGVSVPINEPNKPAINLSFAWNPFFITYRQLDKQTVQLQNAIDLLKVQEQQKNAEQKIKNTQNLSSTLAWNQQSAIDELGIYNQNAKDHAQWFERGLISKFENLQAQLEYTKAVARTAQAKADVIIFNIAATQDFNTQSVQGDK